MLSELLRLFLLLFLRLILLLIHVLSLGTKDNHHADCGKR